MKTLFSLLLLFAGFLLSYGDNKNAQPDPRVEDQIQSKFLLNDIPLRYYSNILIHLEGDITKDDSLIFNQLVDTLNVLIDKWDVYLIAKGLSNLEVNFVNSKSQEKEISGTQSRNKTNEIVKSTVPIFLPPTMDFSTRKKVIYFRMLNALAMRITAEPEFKPIPGSVFTETNSDQIKFLPIDFDIIKKLYSYHYDELFEKQMRPKLMDDPNNNAYKSNKDPFKDPYYMFYSLIVNIFYFASLIFMSLKGSFTDHKYQFLPFIKQGFLIVVVSAIYSGIVTSLLKPNLNILFIINPYFLLLIITLALLVIGLILVISIFLVERAILKGTNNFSLEIFVPFFSIAFVTTVFVCLFLIMTPFGNNVNAYITVLSAAALNSFLIGFCRSIYIYTRKKSENIIRIKDVELARMGELQKQAELQSLRAKINPHFLYNALNSIASLAITDAKKTEQMALGLSDFFKYAINREQKQLNSLSEELNATRTYLEIEKVRFGDRLNFEIECDPELLDIRIPQLLIQPLAENAIKHGLSQITGNGMIRIVITKEANQLNIRVYDNGPAFPEGPLSGFGIQNTQERIALLYGSRATINWKNVPEKFIELSLPFANQLPRA